ncbi:probable DNA metabolism protein [Arenibacter nanhaiticus]|uniref:Probable DNA metabolism protein n=1 Tax=Arenibacter nanhaiticus TaxID=558155 RepID=A0A1M6DSV1_9FLAO|nr:TIGR03915 family putative DNA repair protein [Arenibacter nanhaiticus]SHI76281.1 probable DNA metabolism protein [Arenibacter nanhaiticus]
MEKAKTLMYEGGFNGFLTVIFKSFKENLNVSDIQKQRDIQKGLFSETETVQLQSDKAKRVWDGIQKKDRTALKTIYFAYLSEKTGIEFLLYQYIHHMFFGEAKISSEAIKDVFLKLHQYAGMVAREKHRIEAIATFKDSQDQIHYTAVTPYHDVLPLLSRYYRSKFPGKEFLIYDNKRKYALFYNLLTISHISMEIPTDFFKTQSSSKPLKPLITKTVPYPFSRRANFKNSNQKAAV